jgi:hypothetical protein
MVDSTAPEGKAKGIEYVLARVESSGFGIKPGTFEVCRKISDAGIEMKDPDTGKPFYRLTLDDPYQVFGVRTTIEDWQPPDPNVPLHQKSDCTLYERIVDGKPDGFTSVGEGGPLVRMEAGEDLTGAMMLTSVALAQWFTTGNQIIIDAIRAVLANPYLAFTTADALLWRNDAQALGRVADAVAKEASEADRGRLASALFAELDGFGRTVRAKAKTLGDALNLDEGVPFWDAELARRLDAVGAKAEAEELRKARAKLSKISEWWGLWLPSKPKEAPRAVQILARVLWRNVVLPDIERTRKKPSALVVPVMREVTDFHARGRVFDSDNGQLSFDGREIARMVQTGGRIASVDLSLIQKGLGLLGSRLSHDVLRHEVFEAHRRVLQGETYPNVLTFDGGWSAFAEVLGYSPKKHAIDVRNIVYAQAHFRFTFPDGSKGNMLQYNEKAAIGRHGTARVTLTIGSPLCAGYVHELRESMGKTGLHARQAQRLVPMPRYLPPFHGRANEHGQQASFALALMTELRERAAELAEHGSVRLTHDELTSLADQVALPRKLLVPVLEHWKHDVGDAPAFLRMVDRDRYTLGEAHAAELDFIIEAGRRETRNAALGRASARMRASNARKPRKRGGK